VKDAEAKATRLKKKEEVYNYYLFFCRFVSSVSSVFFNSNVHKIRLAWSRRKWVEVDIPK
jgi:hypothetical protein